MVRGGYQPVIGILAVIVLAVTSQDSVTNTPLLKNMNVGALMRMGLKLVVQENLSTVQKN